MKQALKQIKVSTIDILRSRFRRIRRLDHANAEMLNLCGIHSFFLAEDQYRLFLEYIVPEPEVAEVIARREYGDFQTPRNLSDTVCSLLRSQRVSPMILIEPTFGKGSFIISALNSFPALSQIHGVEIHEPYCWHTKFIILEHFVERPDVNRPSIYLYCDDVFTFDFRSIADTLDQGETLVIGNPPWVTNSELSSLNSTNIPKKSNFKSHNGLDAITGKGNFDIGEYIILMMLNVFTSRPGSLAMLAKNSVIKNVLQDLPKTSYTISNLFAIKIDAKQHFNAAVDASLFRCDFGLRQNTLTCKVASLETPGIIQSEFGWVDQKFVSDIASYQQNRSFDGLSPFVWRQGLKHDCSRVLELDFSEATYKNGFNDSLDIEDDLIFPLIKSSDIQNSPLTTPRKFVIVTQKKVGDDTSYIEAKYPALNKYLNDHLNFFSERKSSIYNGKSKFAIFGIGEYSFKPFKVAISGLYKKPYFSFVRPFNGKPAMLDDTCYFLSFEHQAHAVITFVVLNSEPALKLLSSLTFLDSKRPYTKDILMRIDILKLAEHLGFKNVCQLAARYPGTALPTRAEWDEFLKTCQRASQPKSQIPIFEKTSSLSESPLSEAT